MARKLIWCKPHGFEIRCTERSTNNWVQWKLSAGKYVAYICRECFWLHFQLYYQNFIKIFRFLYGASAISSGASQTMPFWNKDQFLPSFDLNCSIQQLIWNTLNLWFICFIIEKQVTHFRAADILTVFKGSSCIVVIGFDVYRGWWSVVVVAM